MNILVRASADFESNITSVERIKEYCTSDNHEVNTVKLFNCSKNIFNFVLYNRLNGRLSPASQTVSGHLKERLNSKTIRLDTERTWTMFLKTSLVQ